MQLIQVLVLAMAVSMDSLAVGISYGFRRMMITPYVLGLVALFSALLKLAAMLLGGVMVTWFSPAAAPRLGAAILVGLGVWFLLSAALQPGARKENSDAPYGETGTESPIAVLKLRHVGIIIKVLQDPEAADIDKSRTIGGSEAVLLGLALGFDALGAGISAGFLQLPVALTAGAVALGTAVFLSAGMLIGSRLSAELPPWMSRALPGIILVSLGVLTWLTG